MDVDDATHQISSVQVRDHATATTTQYEAKVQYQKILSCPRFLPFGSTFSLFHTVSSIIFDSSACTGCLLQVFIDASYEGDLMAGAGVSYVTGREGVSDFNESLAG